MWIAFGGEIVEDGGYLVFTEGVERSVTVKGLAAILASRSIRFGNFFKPFREEVRPRTPRRRGWGLSLRSPRLR